MRRGPLWMMTWDGAAPWLVDRAMAEGVLPNLARLRARGVSAAGSTTDYPDCNTPPGHAVLWTGKSACRNGITGAWIPSQPPEEHTLLDFVGGYDAKLMLEEPLWVTAARAGLDSTLVHVPLSGPPGAFGEQGRFGFDALPHLKILHGFGPRQGTASVCVDPPLRPARHWKGVPHDLEGALEFQYRARPMSVAVALLRGPDGALDRAWIARDRSQGQDGVLVHAGPDSGFSEPLWYEPGVGLRFRIFDLAPDGSRLRLFMSSAYRTEVHPPALEQSYLDAAGPFVSGGAYGSYERGHLGPIHEDGAAEAAYMETHLMGMEHFLESSRWAATEHQAPLMIFYHPGTDEVGHLWGGYVQQDGVGYDARIDALAWPHIREAYACADRHLGILLDALPEDGTLLLTADHGLNGIGRHFVPNVVLRDAGLLHSFEGNPYRIDLSTTRALYHPANNGFVFVNEKPYRRGWVKPEDREAVLEEVEQALARFVDPDTGKPVLAGVIRVDTLPPDHQLRGQGRGDLFLVLKPGYSMGGTLHREALLEPNLSGQHQQLPGLRCMHAILELAGPGIRQDHRIGVVDHRDVHETARHLLGLQAGDGGGEPITSALIEE